jgi:LPS-assembly protein
VIPPAFFRASNACRFALTPVASVIWLLVPWMAAAQTPLPAPKADAVLSDDGLPLRASPIMRAVIPETDRASMPTFTQSDSLSGRPDLETVLEGNVEMRRGDTVIRADRIDYFQLNDLARARGNVRINRAGDIFEGPLLELKVDAFEGFFVQPRYQLLKNGAHGEADRIDFIDDKRSTIRNATYSTCKRQPGPSWLPDWVLRAASVRLDTQEEVGYATNAVLSFMGVPILGVPALSFPLTDKRKSGFLPPTIGVDSLNGVELIQPYYWNIAPNRDATFFPALLTRRGVDLGGEFRYLEPEYRGQTRLNYMPTDKLRNRARWGASLVHDAALQTGVPGLGALGLNVNLNRVSDDNYWRDFARSGNSLTQRLLPNDIKLSWSQGNYSASLRSLKWQTLQDVTSPILPPYDRSPQLAGRYLNPNVAGLELQADVDSTRFRSDRVLTGQPNARRAYALAQASYPVRTPGWYVVPKVQLNATRYQFESALADGSTSASRSLPTFSVDSGLVFERETNWFGTDLTQTLEPRAFYVRTPYRNQSLLPNYDSGANDFNFATVYTENAFGGQDRISDNNLLTVGVTSRFLLPSGVQVARFDLAQRLRFADQRVTLPGGVPEKKGVSDILLGASLAWDPRWTADATVQYNLDTKSSVRTVVSARYSPGNYRVVNVAYRRQQGQSEQLDIGWQWPLNDLWGDRGQELGAGQGQGEGRWYSVGRLNMSLKDRKLVDTVLGLEYDAGCWLGRVVFERLANGTTTSGTATSTKRILFQLEFVGFTRLGTNPLRTLRDNIPRYQYLREQVVTPSRFTQFD